jgi:hypothetical protein
MFGVHLKMGQPLKFNGKISQIQSPAAFSQMAPPLPL